MTEPRINGSSNGHTLVLLKAETIKNEQLKAKLAEIRNHRRDVQRKQQTIQDIRSKLLVQALSSPSSPSLQQQQQLSTIVAHERRLHALQERLQELNTYDLSDIFWIDVSNTNVGRINGLRLSSSMLQNNNNNNKKPFGPFSSSSSSHNNNNNTTEWREINAGLGSVALLIHTLQNRLHLSSPTYQFRCGASTSQITKKQPPETVLYYNLYFEPSYLFTSFGQFFAKRQFHTATTYLLQAVRELYDHVRQQQQQHNTMALMLPYEMDHDHHTINQVSVHFFESATNNNNDNTTTTTNDWTRAMLYLLTNLKHLLVHCAARS